MFFVHSQIPLFNMEIKGDPHWMGGMQAVVLGKLETPDFSTQDYKNILLKFVKTKRNFGSIS